MRAHSAQERVIPGETVVSPRMLFWAFRYALDRQSYVVDDVAKEVARCDELLTGDDRRRMLVEIDEARAADRIGMKCDDASWSHLERVLIATTAAEAGSVGTKGEARSETQTPTVKIGGKP